MTALSKRQARTDTNILLYSVFLWIPPVSLSILCISASLNSDVTSYIRCGEGKIESTEELKILGFMFGQNPSVLTHVNYMLKKAKKTLWIIRHLKKSGLGSADLLKAFNALVRPSLEYAVPTYHSMLNATMSNEIEKVQMRACKIIFGWESDYQKLLEDETLESLEDRRKKITLKFAQKTEKNERFSDWFPRNEPSRNLRNNPKFIEKFARTDRLKKVHFFYMRRALNEES